MKQIYLAFSNSAKLSDVAAVKGFLKAKTTVVEWTNNKEKNSQNLKNSDYLLIIGDPQRKDTFGRGLYEITIEFSRLHGNSSENVYIYETRGQIQGSICNLYLRNLKDLQIDNSRDWKRFAKFSTWNNRIAFMDLIAESPKPQNMLTDIYTVSFKLKDWVYQHETREGAYRTIDGYRVTYLGKSRIDGQRMFSVSCEVGVVLNQLILTKLVCNWRFEQAWGCPAASSIDSIEIIKSLEDEKKTYYETQVDKYIDLWDDKVILTKEKITVHEDTVSSNLLLLG